MLRMWVSTEFSELIHDVRRTETGRKPKRCRSYIGRMQIKINGITANRGSPFNRHVGVSAMRK